LLRKLLNILGLSNVPVFLRKAKLINPILI
jgi:hypothetical protein